MNMDDKQLNETLQEYALSTHNSKEKILSGVRLEKPVRTRKSPRATLVAFASALCALAIVFCIAFPIAFTDKGLQSDGDDTRYNGMGELTYNTTRLDSLDRFSTQYGMTALIPTRTERGCEGDFYYTLTYYYAADGSDKGFAQIEYEICEEETLYEIRLMIIPKKIEPDVHNRFKYYSTLDGSATWRKFSLSYHEQFDEEYACIKAYVEFEDDTYNYYVRAVTDPHLSVTELLDWIYEDSQAK